MIWPGMGDPAKRKKTLRFLAITAGIAISTGLASLAIQNQFNDDNPLKQCIDNREIKYKISSTIELIVNGEKAEIPANIGRNPGCIHSLYTLSNDGVIYVEWEKEYPFEIGHFLWTWTTYHKDGFPMRDMDESKSRILVNGVETSDYISAKLVDGNHYKAEFVTKGVDTAKDHDFLPPES